MIELTVTETIIDLTTAESIRVDVYNSTGIDIQLTEGQVIPAVTLDVGVQGPQGIQGVTGDKGDPLTFDALTEEQKQALRGDVGTTSTNYVNILYQAMI